MSGTEAVLAERLRRMRWVAGGLLGAMLALFLAASRYAAAYPALEIGRALAGFIHDHFLDRGAVARRLEQTDFASRLGAWLARPANSANSSRDIADALHWLLDSGASAELRAALQGSLMEALDRARPSALLSAGIDVLAHGAHAQNLVDELVRIAYSQLEVNKDRLRARIRERSPWWLPRFVDNEIYDRLVQEFERILGEIRETPDHEARRQLTSQLDRLKAALARGDAMDDKTRALRDAFLKHPAVAAYLADLWQELGRYAAESLNEPTSVLRLGLERQLASIGRSLRDDAVTRDVTNQWLRGLVLYLVGSYRGALSELVSGTIAEWDPAATAERLELYLGRDLQFIRINGTVVGGLVGVAIYTLTTLFER
jgi:uncharacterized membrane-anchored protein YjiN (DUF445 family)